MRTTPDDPTGPKTEPSNRSVWITAAIFAALLIGFVAWSMMSLNRTPQSDTSIMGQGTQQTPRTAEPNDTQDSTNPSTTLPGGTQTPGRQGNPDRSGDNADIHKTPDSMSPPGTIIPPKPGTDQGHGSGQDTGNQTPASPGASGR